MAKSIEDLLSLPNLMGIVEETTSGLPQEKFLPAGFWDLKSEVIGDEAEATLLKGQRKTSRLIRYASPPVGATPETIGAKPWKLMHTSEILDINPVVYQQLRAYDQWALQKKGMTEIGRQAGLFMQKRRNLRATVLTMFLHSGLAYFDGSGNLLPSSSGAVDTIDMAIPATNQGQLPSDGSNALVTVPWNQPTANIPLDLRKIRKAAVQATGMEPEIAMYGENVPGFIQTNSYCKDYLARNPKMNQDFVTSGEIPDGFLDLTWVPAYKAFFEDSTGTNQPIWDGDRVTFLPKPNKSWYELLLGSMLCPTSIDIQTGYEAAMDKAEVKYGEFLYAFLRQLPLGLAIVAGDTVLSTIKNPQVLWQLDCTF